MDAFVRKPNDEQRIYFEQAQTGLGLPPASIEKDFWVCWMLWKLFSLPEWGVHLIFKGGTSLSKGWGLIERFSEDIDIVINRDFLGFGGDESPEKAPSNKQRKKRFEGLRMACQSFIRSALTPALQHCFIDTLPSDAEWALEIAPPEEDPDGQTLLFQYPRALTVSSPYLRLQVKIEFGARSDTWPTESPTIRPYLAQAYPEIFATGSFQIKAVSPERTFWEKAMLLHEETYRPPEKGIKGRLARHYYDLWCLIEKGVSERVLQNPDLFSCVAEHRAAFFHQNWVNYETLRPGSLRLLPGTDQIAAWQQDYNAMRGEMFFGEVPTFDDILGEVGTFERKFNQG